MKINGEDTFDMNYREINLRSLTQQGAATEIMYEIASARADGVDLMRINVFYEEDNIPEINKTFSSIIKLLKQMKQGGAIHFFATKDSFAHTSTEAIFLQNKYPELFSIQPDIQGGAFIYIKL